MIIVFGSLNVDMVLPVSRLPHPGETTLCSHYTLFPGGKGANQAVAAARAGAQVHFFGKVGQDEFSQTARSILETVPTLFSQGIASCQEIPTGCATIWVDRQGENMIVVASGANSQAQASQVPDALLTPENTLVLQMETPHQENFSLMERAHQRGTRIILNVAPAALVPDSILKMVDVLITNQGEAFLLGEHLGCGTLSVEEIAERLAQAFNLICIVTLGAQGAVAGAPQTLWRVSAMPLQAIDTTAAGDAFVGAFAASFDQNQPLPHALHRASVASGLACLKIGAQPSLPEQLAIEAAMTSLPAPQRVK